MKKYNSDWEKQIEWYYRYMDSYCYNDEDFCNTIVTEINFSEIIRLNKILNK